MRHAFICASLFIAITSLTAQAGDKLHETGIGYKRWIGYGWSQGYHAYDNCCPMADSTPVIGRPGWMPLYSHSGPATYHPSVPARESILAPTPAMSPKNSAPLPEPMPAAARQRYWLNNSPERMR